MPGLVEVGAVRKLTQRDGQDLIIAEQARMTGGEYFFQPSISALRRLSQLSAANGGAGVRVRNRLPA